MVAGKAEVGGWECQSLGAGNLAETGAQGGREQKMMLGCGTFWGSQVQVEWRHNLQIVKSHGR